MRRRRTSSSSLIFPVEQQIDGVVGFHDGQRLQKQGGLGLGLVVDDPRDGPLVVGLEGDDVAPVALGDDGVLQGLPIFRPEKRLLDLTVNPFPGVGQFPAHPGESRARLVQDEIMRADALLDGFLEAGEVFEAGGQEVKVGGQLRRQPEVLAQVAGEDQDLQNLVEGLGVQQAAAHGGLGEPGGQGGEVGQGRSALPVLQLLPFADLVKF